MSIKYKNINLLLRLKNGSKQGFFNNGRVRFFAPITAFALFILIFIGYYLLYKIPEVNGERDRINTYLMHQTTRDNLDKAIRLYNEQNEILHDLNNIKSAVENFDAYPELTKEIYDTLIERARLGSVKIVNIQYARSQNLITLKCGATDVARGADYVQELKKTELFANVDYTGYLGEGNVSGVPSGYTFQIKVTIASKEEAE